LLLRAAAGLALVLLAGAPVRLAAQAAGPARDPLAPRSKGAASAPVTVYEMSDFQCPYCRKHALEVFPALEKEYVQPGKVRWVYINFPLVSIHANALPAAELAMCAARMGKFWPVHDLLFQHQATWSPLKEAGPFLLSLADSVKLPRAAMVKCLESGTVRAEIQQEAEGSERSGAASTPTFYIEGGLLAGARPLELWRQILDSIHAEKAGR
jgi:protein-disulfide isomerase